MINTSEFQQLFNVHFSCKQIASMKHEKNAHIKKMHTSVIEIELEDLWKDPSNLPWVFVTLLACESAQSFSLKLVYRILIEIKEHRVLIKCFYPSEHQVQLKAAALQSFPCNGPLTPPEGSRLIQAGKYISAFCVLSWLRWQGLCRTVECIKLTDAHLQAQRAAIAPKPSQTDFLCQKKAGSP